MRLILKKDGTDIIAEWRSTLCDLAGSAAKGTHNPMGQAGRKGHFRGRGLEGGEERLYTDRSIVRGR